MDYKTQRSSSHAHITDSSPTIATTTTWCLMMNLNLKKSFSHLPPHTRHFHLIIIRIIELMLSFDLTRLVFLCLSSFFFVFLWAILKTRNFVNSSDLYFSRVFFLFGGSLLFVERAIICDFDKLFVNFSLISIEVWNNKHKISFYKYFAFWRRWSRLYDERLIRSRCIEFDVVSQVVIVRFRWYLRHIHRAY